MLVAKRNGDDTNLYLVHVVDTRAFQNISSFDTAMVEQVTETAKKTMDGYANQAKEQGLKNISYSVEYGSVTEYVTRTADCDVLVVRTDLENKPALNKKGKKK